MTRSLHLARLLTLAATAMLAAPAFAADEKGHAHAETTVAHAGEDHAQDGDEDRADAAEHAFEASGLKVVHPWMNATDGREALIFLELENTGEDPLHLEGARMPAAETVTLVGFVLERGAAFYQDLPLMRVQPGRSLKLEPHGLALRATGLSTEFFEGDTTEFVLLTSAGDIALRVTIEAAEAHQHSHEGHAH